MAPVEILALGAKVAGEKWRRKLGGRRLGKRHRVRASKQQPARLHTHRVSTIPVEEYTSTMPIITVYIIAIIFELSCIERGQIIDTSLRTVRRAA